MPLPSRACRPPTPDRQWLGTSSYPISTYSCVIIYQKQSNANNGIALGKMLDWMATAGQADAAAIGCVPLPGTSSHWPSPPSTRCRTRADSASSPPSTSRRTLPANSSSNSIVPAAHPGLPLLLSGAAMLFVVLLAALIEGIVASRARPSVPSA